MILAEEVQKEGMSGYTYHDLVERD